MLSLWSRSSRSYFTGLEGALSLNGDVRTTTVGADWVRGPLSVGLSVGRTLGLGGYSGPSAGQMTTSMTGSTRGSATSSTTASRCGGRSATAPAR